jgi:eukaryotic-like serine/threonine-protein kinase
MGVVYRARDTRLDRDVALKVLADGLAKDADAMRRFEQEARAASSLNHPNIVTVYDAGVDEGTAYLVTELLQGITLRERSSRGDVRQTDSLEIAIQIAAGLAAAHGAGIVHRDIKPHNIFLTRGGDIKLLDFGIARLVKSPASGRATGETPATLTREGAIMGTPAYMAPEQIRGQPVDGRADIFAFGCVLHEMFSGVSPFQRSTPADAMAAVLADALPARTGDLGPPALERIVRRCLEKDVADRFQSAADLQFALEAARDVSAFPTAPSPAPRKTHRRLGIAAAVLTVMTMAGLWASRVSTSSSDAVPRVLFATSVVPASARPIAPAVSPDGKWVTYVGLAGDEPNLYVQYLNGGPPVNLTRGLGLPLQTRTVVGGIDVHPDGSGIGVAGRPRPTGLWRLPGIWVVPAPLGGSPRLLTERYASVRWSPDGRQIAAIIANPLVGDAVVVAAADGQDERILVPAAGGIHLHHVAWGHDGRFLYFTRTLEPNHALGEIYRVAVSGGSPEPVVTTQGIAMFPALTPDGLALIYAGDRGGDGLNIWWRPLNGTPEHRLTIGAGEFTEPFISRDGRHLVVLARKRRGAIVKVGADEGQVAVLETMRAEAAGDVDPSVSPTTGRLFVTSRRSGRRNIWSTDADGGNPVPITSGTDDDRRPAVSRDGRQVAFVSNRNGRRGIWTVPAQGGTPRPVVHSDVLDYLSWAPDGRRIVYGAGGGSEATVWTVSLEGGKPVQLSPVSARVPGGRRSLRRLRLSAWSVTGRSCRLFRRPANPCANQSESRRSVSLRRWPGRPTASAWVW